MAEAEGLELTKQHMREGQPGLSVCAGKGAVSRKTRWRKLQRQVRSKSRKSKSQPASKPSKGAVSPVEHVGAATDDTDQQRQLDTPEAQLLRADVQQLWLTLSQEATRLRKVGLRTGVTSSSSEPPDHKRRRIDPTSNASSTGATLVTNALQKASELLLKDAPDGTRENDSASFTGSFDTLLRSVGHQGLIQLAQVTTEVLCRQQGRMFTDKALNVVQGLVERLNRSKLADLHTTLPLRALLLNLLLRANKVRRGSDQALDVFRRLQGHVVDSASGGSLNVTEMMTALSKTSVGSNSLPPEYDYNWVWHYINRLMVEDATPQKRLRVILNRIQNKEQTQLRQAQARLKDTPDTSMAAQNVTTTPTVFYPSIRNVVPSTSATQVLAKSVCSLYRVLGNQSLRTMYLVVALRKYFKAYETAPHSPSLCLTIAAVMLSVAVHKRSVQSREHLLGAFGMLNQYCELRMQQSGSGGATPVVDAALEVRYNFGRAFHQLNLLHLAQNCYEEVLEMCRQERRKSERSDSNSEVSSTRKPGIERETAYNLALIYNGSGSPHLANAIIREFISI